VTGDAKLKYDAELHGVREACMVMSAEQRMGVLFSYCVEVHNVLV